MEKPLSPGVQAMLELEELHANDRIAAINEQIGELIIERGRVEQNMFRVIDIIIEHAGIMVSFPTQREPLL